MDLDDAILESIERRHLYVVYHFMGLGYLPNLFARGGLWCASTLKEWGDEFDDDPYRWGPLEKGLAFSHFVSCSVNPPMGMLTKAKRPVLLELRAPVLAFKDVAFIGKWSSYADVEPVSATRQVGIEWFDKMFLNEATNHANPHPGEFLVPTRVPLNFVRNLVFYTPEDLEEARGSVKGMTWPQDVPYVKLGVQVAPGKFGRKMQEG